MSANTITKAELYASISEAELQRYVKDLALQHHWLYYHATDSRKDPRGLPDTVLVGHGRCIFAELKSQKGRLRPEQKQWIAALEQSGTEVYIWRPSDLPTIEAIMSGKGA